MKDFSKTIMYKIVGSGMTYYGHTTKTLEKRKGVHISDAKGNGSYCTSKFIIDAGDWEMLWLEDYPCANTKEAHAREGWWIRNHDCVNKVIPGRTIKEYHMEYYETHRADILEYQRKHYETHRAEKAEYQKAYREANKADILEYQRKHYETHRAEKAEYQKAYNDAHKAEKAEYNKAYKQWNKSWDGLNKIKI